MKRWVIELVNDLGATIEVAGYHENKRSPRQQFRVVLERNTATEPGFQVHRGRVVTAEGVTEKKGLTLMSHLYATHQFKPGVSVVL